MADFLLLCAQVAISHISWKSVASLRTARAVDRELEAESDSTVNVRWSASTAEASFIPLGAPSLSGARTDAKHFTVEPSLQPIRSSTRVLNQQLSPAQP